MLFKWLHKLVDKRIEQIIGKRMEHIRQAFEMSNNKVIDKAVTERILAVFADKNDKYYTRYGDQFPTVGGQFKQRAYTDLHEKMNNLCNRTVIAYVEGETFIDTVVNRINSKQLG